MILSRSSKQQGTFAEKIFYELRLKLNLKKWARFWEINTRHQFEHDKFFVPVTNAADCISCGWCVSICPVDVIDLDSKHVPLFTRHEMMERLQHPLRPHQLKIDEKNCLKCGQCVDVCPTEALSFPKINLEASQNEASLVAPKKAIEK